MVRFEQSAVGCRCRDINNNVLSIISEIVALGEFCSYELVVTTLLDRYNVQNWIILDVGPTIELIPSLQLLFSLNMKVGQFISSYISANIIGSLSDLEIELFNFLKALNFPTLNSSSQYNSIADPNEIDLSTELQASVGNNGEVISDISNSFSTFGMGPLRRHPLVQKILPHNSIYQIDTSKVLKHLVKYMNSIDGSEDKMSSLEVYFPTYLTDYYKVKFLGELDVWIIGDLKEIIPTLKSVIRQEQAFQAAFIREQLMNLPIKNDSSSKSAEKVAAVNNLVPVLKTPSPSDSALLKFLNDIQSISMGESQFSPSKKKIKDVVTSMLVSLDLKKATGESLARLECISAAAIEYAFLQLGSKKKVRKLYLSMNEKELNDSMNSSNKEEVDYISEEEMEGKDEKEEVVHSIENERYLTSSKQNIAPEEALEPTPSTASLGENPSNYISMKSEKRARLEGTNSNQSFKAQLEMRSQMTFVSSSPPSELYAEIGPEALNCLPNSLWENTDSSDIKSVGRLGESIVYHFLQSTLPTNFEISWMNKISESCAAYDLTVQSSNSKTFIEVKSSRYEEKNVFEISLWEWQFATGLPHVNYHLYRVINVCDKHRTKIYILKDIQKLLEIGRIKLCLAI